MDLAQPLPPVSTPEVETDNAPVEPVPVATTLQGLSREFALFTPAVLYTYGRFQQDIVALFCCQHPEEDAGLRPFALDLQWPIFAGLGKREDYSLDHRLYAIRKERWELCREFIARIAIQDHRDRFYCEVAHHELELADPIAMHNGAVIGEVPTFKLTAFAVNSNQFFAFLAPDVGSLHTLARPVRSPPRDPAIQLRGDVVLGPPPDPQAALRRW